MSAAIDSWQALRSSSFHERSQHVRNIFTGGYCAIRKSPRDDFRTQAATASGSIFGGVGPILEGAYPDPPTAPGGPPGPGECGRTVRGGRSRRWCGMPPRRIHTEMIQAISALNLLLNLFLNSGAESMVQQE
jgi:hypothetical protein